MNYKNYCHLCQLQPLLPSITTLIDQFSFLYGKPLSFELFISLTLTCVIYFTTT